jgi:hypothetical protein
MAIEEALPQPTESEAIVAALQADAGAALAPPVALPVDVATDLPNELRHPEAQVIDQDSVIQRRKDDAVGGESG